MSIAVGQQALAADVLKLGQSVYGDGSDGDVTIAENTSLTRDMFYNTLTVNAGIALNAFGYRIFVKETLTNNGFIGRSGVSGIAATSGGPGAGGAETASGSLGKGGAGGSGAGSAGQSAAGGGGAAGGVLFIAARIIINSSGIIRVNGGDGGDAWLGTATGAGDQPGGTAGTATALTAAQGGFRSLPQGVLLHTPAGALVNGGGAGGGGSTTVAAGSAGGGVSNALGGSGGAGGGAADSNGAGGGGTGGGGLLCIVYTSATWGTEEAYPGATVGIGVGVGENGSLGLDGTVIKIANA